MRLRLSPLIAGLALAVTACAGPQAGPMARTISTLPPTLGSCHEGNVGPEFGACYDELAAYLRVRTIALADGRPPAQIHFIDAYAPLIGELVPRFGGGFSLDTPTGDADEVRTSTAPLRTTWSLGGDPTTLWACFADGTVTVGRTACADVP